MIIKLTYNLSSTLFYKLLKEAKSNSEERDRKDILNQSDSEKDRVLKEFIGNVIKPPTSLISIKNIQKQIYDKFGAKKSDHQISRILKEDLKYSYRRGGSQPPKYGDSRVMAQKRVFGIELMMIVHKLQVIYNIDEGSFERSLKQSYSWLPKSGGGAIINDLHKGKASLILATGCDLTWFAIVKPETVKSNTFGIFLLLFKAIFATNHLSNKNTKTLIFDNAKTHHSKLASAVMNTLGFQIKFLPPYYPEVAPDEQIFKALKAKIRAASREKIINIRKD